MSPLPVHPRAALFDLDGTLLNSLGDLTDCINEALQGQGFPPHAETAVRGLIGDGLRMLVTRALPESERGASQIDACLEEMHALYDRHWARRSQPYDGIEPLLTELAKRGLRLAVLSNKPDDFTPRVVKHFFPQVPFEAILGAGHDVPRKPDPAGALVIAKQFGLSPADFLYLGDSGTDMKTAVGAGMFPIGVLWGFRDEPELKETGARLLLKHPLDLLSQF